MKLTPGRLILFRMINMTVCRSHLGERLLRIVLQRLVVGRREAGDDYCQSADFFTFDQLDGPSRRER